jgi:glycosyltransferase involved in cell wall biosynthesis
MKVAVFHNLPSGGGKRALLEMLRGLKAHHALDVFSLSSAEQAFCDLHPYTDHHFVFPFRPLPMAGSPFGRVNPWLRILNLLRVRSAQRQVAARIDANGYDVAFVHNCQFAQSPPILGFLQTPSAYFCAEPPRLLYEPSVPRPYARAQGFRRVLDHVDPAPGLYRATLRRMDAHAARAATVVLANSAFSHETLYRVYGVNARICYLGVDTEKFRPLDLPKRDFVLSVGAMHRGKGYGFLIRSLGRIPAQARPRLIIVSNAVEPNEYQFLSGLAGESGVHMEVQVLVPEEELALLYNQALLTLYTPVLEPFGLVPLESMACGTPVVGVREGGVRESVADGISGLLVDRDEQAFAEAVRCLLADSERRQELGAQGRAHVEREWRWARCLETLEAAFASAVSAGGDGQSSRSPK